MTITQTEVTETTNKMTITANKTLKEIGEILAGANSVLLFPHDNADADSAGACLALCRMLRQQGKEAYILTDKPLPGFLQFLLKATDSLKSAGPSAEEDLSAGEKPWFTTDLQVIPEPEISFLVDCNVEKRISGRAEAFRRGKTSLCIDHHRETVSDSEYYYLDHDAAAASQIVFRLFREMEWPMDLEIARDLYTGLDGDTGCFMHSNTTPEVHRMAADLLEYGFDINEINVNLYLSNDPKAVQLKARALQSMDFLAGGKAVMAKLTRKDLEELNADIDQTESVIDELRSIDGVEIAALLKEDLGRIRVSMRAKTDGNVAAIAQKFGGGGHIKAAGFKMERPLEEVYSKLREQIAHAVQALEPGEKEDEPAAAEKKSAVTEKDPAATEIDPAATEKDSVVANKDSVVADKER